MSEAIAKLFLGLNHHYDLFKGQIDFGIKKAEKYVGEDLKVDVPHAPETLEAFKMRLSHLKFVE